MKKFFLPFISVAHLIVYCKTMTLNVFNSRFLESYKYHCNRIFYHLHMNEIHNMFEPIAIKQYMMRFATLAFRFMFFKHILERLIDSILQKSLLITWFLSKTKSANSYYGRWKRLHCISSDVQNIVNTSHQERLVTLCTVGRNLNAGFVSKQSVFHSVYYSHLTVAYDNSKEAALIH